MSQSGTSAYDSLNRLTIAKNMNTLDSYCWTYDDFGNRTASVTETGDNTCPAPSYISPTVSYNANNQVTWVQNTAPAGFVYDASGDVTSDALNQYLYDAEGRVLARTDTFTRMKGCMNKSRKEKYVAIVVLACLFLGLDVFAETVDGFVTHIDSPTSFDIGALHITLDTNSRCSVATTYLWTNQRGNPWVAEMVAERWSHGAAPWTTNRSNIPCSTTKLSQYAHIHLYGSVSSNNGSFVAQRLILYKTALDISLTNLNDGIVLEESPVLFKEKQGWYGKIWMDGYPVAITPHTMLLSLSPDSTFRFRFHGTKIAAYVESSLKGKPAQFSPAKLSENTCIVFQADHPLYGNVTATKLQFWPNWIDPKEKKYDDNFIVTTFKPDYVKGIPGTIRFSGADPIVILPNRTIQDWVTGLGNTLVPEYQRNLPSSDETKIDFRFYVVHAFQAWLGNHFIETNGPMPTYQILDWDRSSDTFYRKPKANATVRNIVAAPDGMVLVPDTVLGELQNIAQLATLLSTAITSVVQRQGYHAWPNYVIPNKWEQGSYFRYGNPANVGIWQNEQALRIGIRQMYLAGYDIREAPFAWAVAQGKPITNPIIDSKHPDREIPWYAAYAFNYISQYYSDVDYSKLKKGEAEYQQFLGELRKADPEAFEKK